MGAILSHLKTLHLALKLLLEANKSLQALLARASAAPGLPVPNPTASYWLADPPHPELVDVRSPGGPPAEADVVIIGSGITGAAVARSLLLSASASKENQGGGGNDGDGVGVVVLEARTLCSGATGRNGGHIKASPHELFAQLRRAGMVPERAAALVRFQLKHLTVLTQLCEAEGWADVAECRQVETVDLYLDEGDRDAAFAEVEELCRWVPEVGIQMWDATEAREKFKVNEHVKGAISYTAGALWPFRFVSCVWKDLLTKYEKRLSLETETSVLSIASSSSSSSSSRKGGDRGSEYAYQVTTNRGTIKCNHVVHATNGFATQFIPGLRGKLTGALGTMTAQRPGDYFPSDLGGKKSWSIVYGKGTFDYATQRPSSPTSVSTSTPTITSTATSFTEEEDRQRTPVAGGDLMIGGGFTRSRDAGASMIGVWDDGRLDALPTAHLTGILRTIFEPNSGAQQRRDLHLREEGSTKQAWSGVLGFTGDLLPFVGRLNPQLTGREVVVKMAAAQQKTKKKKGYGEWVAAGYCGDGMVWAWLSGTALGIMIASEGEGYDEDDKTREDDDLLERPGRPRGRLTEWFPPELLPSLSRVKKAGLENLAEMFA